MMHFKTNTDFTAFVADRAIYYILLFQVHIYQLQNVAIPHFIKLFL